MFNKSKSSSAVAEPEPEASLAGLTHDECEPAGRYGSGSYWRARGRVLRYLGRERTPDMDGLNLVIIRGDTVPSSAARGPALEGQLADMVFEPINTAEYDRIRLAANRARYLGEHPGAYEVRSAPIEGTLSTWLAAVERVSTTDNGAVKVVGDGLLLGGEAKRLPDMIRPWRAWRPLIVGALSGRPVACAWCGAPAEHIVPDEVAVCVEHSTAVLRQERLPKEIATDPAYYEKVDAEARPKPEPEPERLVIVAGGGSGWSIR